MTVMGMSEDMQPMKSEMVDVGIERSLEVLESPGAAMIRGLLPVRFFPAVSGTSQDAGESGDEALRPAPYTTSSPG